MDTTKDSTNPTFKVCKTTNANKLAAAIIATFNECPEASITCLGIGQHVVECITRALCVANNILDNSILSNVIFSEDGKPEPKEYPVRDGNGNETGETEFSAPLRAKWVLSLADKRKRQNEGIDGLHVTQQSKYITKSKKEGM